MGFLGVCFDPSVFFGGLVSFGTSVSLLNLNTLPPPPGTTLRLKSHPSIRLSEYFFLRDRDALRGFGIKDPNKVLFGITHILLVLDS